MVDHPHTGEPWALKWLIRSLLVGLVFLAVWLVARFGPPWPYSGLVGAVAGALLGVCLIVAAVAFVFEVVRRVMAP